MRGLLEANKQAADDARDKSTRDTQNFRCLLAGNEKAIEDARNQSTRGTQDFERFI